MITELDIRTSSRYRGADINMVNRSMRGNRGASTDASEETQKKLADKYAELFKIFLKYKDQLNRVTFWGVYDGRSWIARGNSGSPLLFDRQYQPKLCFDAVVKTVESKQ